MHFVWRHLFCYIKAGVWPNSLWMKPKYLEKAADKPALTNNNINFYCTLKIDIAQGACAAIPYSESDSDLEFRRRKCVSRTRERDKGSGVFSIVNVKKEEYDMFVLNARGHGAEFSDPVFTVYVINPFTLRTPLEPNVCYSHTFENNFRTKRKLTKYLMESCSLASYKHF